MACEGASLEAVKLLASGARLERGACSTTEREMMTKGGFLGRYPGTSSAHVRGAPGVGRSDRGKGVTEKKFRCLWVGRSDRG